MKNTVSYASYAKLLALFSGVSLLAFGTGYFATLQVKQSPLGAIAGNHYGTLNHSLAGLPIGQTKQMLRQASFKFLTTSAYSLVDAASDKSTTDNDLSHQASPSQFATRRAGNS